MIRSRRQVIGSVLILVLVNVVAGTLRYLQPELVFTEIGAYVLASTEVSLLAIWTATSSKSWFTRFSGLTAGVLFLAIVVAGPFTVLVFMVQASVILLILGISMLYGMRLTYSGRLDTRSDERLRLSIGHLLMAMTVVALILALAVDMDRQSRSHPFMHALNFPMWLSLRGVQSAFAGIVAALTSLCTTKGVARYALFCCSMAAYLSLVYWIFPDWSLRLFGILDVVQAVIVAGVLLTARWRVNRCNRSHAEVRI